MEPVKLEIQADDLLKVAQAKFQADPVFQMEVKCMALIRMLEAANARIAELEIGVSPDPYRWDLAQSEE